MDFPDKARRTERSAPRKSLVERAAAILDNTVARAPEPPRASNTAAAAAVPSPAPSTPAYVPPPPPAAHAPVPPAVAVPPPAPAVAPFADTEAATGKRVTRKQMELNFSRLREKGFVVPGDRSTTAEEIRLIKRTLLRQAFSDGRPQGKSHLIMVTSARPSEGKTFMAINLALSMALEKDITVLLIDADVAQPAVPGVLGFESDRGLLDLLVDPKLDMSEVMIRTNIETLSVLPAGRDMPNANELLASAKMEALVDDIARRYPDRVIIFDTPPVLVRTETSVLAAHVGQVAFVIEAEHTNETAVKESLELLNGCSNIGLILNKLRSSYGTERFGQYYGRYKR
jgi:protein-tyrosine kinase